MRGAFRDRAHAARSLADMVPICGFQSPVLLAITVADVALVAELKHITAAPAELAVAVPVSPPWKGGTTYGAVAFDGSVVLHESGMVDLGLSGAAVREAVRGSAREAAELAVRLRGPGAFPDLHDRTAIIIDDGAAHSLVVQAAVAAVRNAGARSVVAVLATAGRHDLHRLAPLVTHVFCACQRSFRNEHVFEDPESPSEEVARDLVSQWSAGGPTGNPREGRTVRDNREIFRTTAN